MDAKIRVNRRDLNLQVKVTDIGQQILTIEELQPENGWHFCLKNGLND